MDSHRIEETVARGMCIGCGACAVASGGTIEVTLGVERLYQANLSGASSLAIRSGSRVCPFSDEAPDEDTLGAPHGDPSMSHDPLLGTYTRTFAGRVSDDHYLRGSSSGGLTSWLLGRLIDSETVDAVINVGRPAVVGKELFEYGVTREAGRADRRKSHYYSSTMAGALTLIEDSDLRYAIVGIPCYIRAARALCLEKPGLASRLVLFVGLVCGHDKTQAFAESLAWQLGVAPGDLGDVDFRVKAPERPSSDYDFGARRIGEERWRLSPTRELIGANWGHGAFQPEACNFCDDVVAETADVSFGDAWLPGFTADSRGTNVVVSRNRLIDGLFEEGALSGQITVLPLTPEEAAQSQAGAFRHRREGLSLRLADDAELGLSVPRKRVAPDALAVAPRRAALLRQRRKMSALSHVAFREALESGDLRVYLRAMRREIRAYERLETSLLVRVLLRTKRFAVLVWHRITTSSSCSGGTS